MRDALFFCINWMAETVVLRASASTLTSERAVEDGSKYRSIRAVLPATAITPETSKGL